MARSVFRFLSRQPDYPELADGTLVLRLPDYGDFRQWHRLRHASRAFLQPWEPTWRSDELTEASFRVRVSRNRQEYASGLSVPLFIFDSRDMTLLGGITIGHIRKGAAQNCMIGYWMGAVHAGKGHMFAAVRLVIPYIFEGLRLHRIEAACIPDNERSIRLLEKSGFEREGLLRKYLKINGEWRDHLMFSLIAENDRQDGRSASS
ncbi:GNAT family N-acetyltransferase [Rhizobiaceae bacterium BDR2-2]|uniref:GNAT family N-acetyltransferase n=1 Tax=Ectorhizobium quercum TaxID=2965071 RepID=A0AAE3N4V7_9HYPH|nr:GNAT family protein [Ectorhizobium quercum]MCX8996394.1 GNAT family N-acetyltransferase [Ectorhizobium quercum]MCX8998567.1 GNAT family N-acetyltransferase [Ectorhizobium quercum]